MPSAEDCAKHEKCVTTDVFGRQRHAEERSNRGGVGSFFSPSRTLYVGYGGASDALGAKLPAVVARVFGEWGPLEDVYCVRSKSIAFVRFCFRASAEFAKETMANQSLQPPWWPGQGGDLAAPEVLNVRWAYDDPNPTAIRRIKREYEEAFGDSAERAEARLPAEQRAALQQERAMQDALAAAPPAATALPYPDTEAQFQTEAYAAWAAAAVAQGYRPEEVAAFYASQRAAAPAAAQAGAAPGSAAAPDCYEYDADDPDYDCAVEEVGVEEEPAAGRGRDEPEPPGPPVAVPAPAPPVAVPARAPPRAGAAPAAAPLAMLGAYDSD